MVFIVRGVIAANGTNAAWAGQYTYVSEPNMGFYQWDGLHKVKRFATAEAAVTAASECRGPLFKLPDPGTIEALPLEEG